MRSTPENTIFIAVAAWPDWEKKTELFRRSAKKFNIPIIFLDRGAKWQGFVQHKVLNMRKYLQSVKVSNPSIKYAFILDCRDVLFFRYVDEICKTTYLLNQARVTFNIDWPRYYTYPFRSVSLLSEISRYFSGNNIVNGGACFGEIDVLLSFYDKIVELRHRYIIGDVAEYPVINLIRDQVGMRYRDDDQFFYQLAQSIGFPLIDVDRARHSLCFAGPTLPCGVRDIDFRVSNHRDYALGTAGVFHAPRLFNLVPFSKIESWALDEDII